MTLRMTLSKFVNRRGEQQTLPEGRFESVLTKYKRRYVTLLKDLDNYLGMTNSYLIDAIGNRISSKGHSLELYYKSC